MLLAPRPESLPSPLCCGAAGIKGRCGWFPFVLATMVPCSEHGPRENQKKMGVIRVIYGRSHIYPSPSQKLTRKDVFPFRIQTPHALMAKGPCRARGEVQRDFPSKSFQIGRCGRSAKATGRPHQHIALYSRSPWPQSAMPAQVRLSTSPSHWQVFPGWSV